MPLALLTGPFLPDLFISCIALVFLSISINNKLWFYYKNKFFYFFLFFYTYIILRSFLSDSIFLSLESSFFYFRFYIFALAVWFLINNNKKLIKTFTLALALTFLLALVDGLYQVSFDENLFGFRGRLDNRLTLVFSDRMVMGGYISRLFPLLIGLIIYSLKFSKLNLLITLGFLILSDIIIYVSGERTAIALLFISTILILICVSKLRIARLITFIFSLIIIFFLTIFNTGVKERSIDYTINQMNIGQEGRVVVFSDEHEKLFISAINIFKDNPLFGIGPKLFRNSCEIEKDSNIKYGCSTHPHNTYLQILAELGIFGTMFILIASFYTIFKLLFHIISFYDKSKIRKLNDYQICLLICFMITLFPFLPTHSFFNNWISIIYFLPLGFYLETIYGTENTKD